MTVYTQKPNQRVTSREQLEFGDITDTAQDAGAGWRTGTGTATPAITWSFTTPNGLKAKRTTS